MVKLLAVLQRGFINCPEKYFMKIGNRIKTTFVTNGYDWIIGAC